MDRKRIYEWALALVVSIGLAACASSTVHETGKRDLSDEERAAMLVQIAQGALVEGDPAGAITRLFEAEKLDPDSPQLHYVKSLAFYRSGDKTEAMKAARKAVELDPKHTAAQNTLGKLLMDDGKYSEAETHLMRAAADPTNRERFMPDTNLGILYYRTGRFKRAETYLNRAISTSPAYACVAYYYRGHLALQHSNVESAIRDYEKSVDKFCGNFAEGHFALGVAFSRNKEYDRARKKFLELKKLYPDSKLAMKAMERLKYLP